MRLMDADDLEKIFANLVPYVIDNALDEAYMHGLDAGHEALQNMPTVDAVPVIHGRWLTCEDGWGDEHYQCSECGLEWVLNDGTPLENDMHYCPNCGARMDGEKE